MNRHYFFSRYLPGGRTALGILVGLGMAGLLWWFFFRTVETVDTVPVQYGSVEHAVTALGVLQPRRYVDVGAQVSGQIRQIAVKVGDRVKKGDLLMEIDPAVQLSTVQANRATLASLRAQLAEQQARYDLTLKQTRRQQQLDTNGATKTEDLEAAQTEQQVALARINNLKAQIEGAQFTLQGNEALLGYTRIFTPMNGTVVSLDVREEQTLNATYATPNLLRVADMSQMTVWAEVSEADVGRIRTGMPVYFTTLGLQDSHGQARRWHGRLRQVLPAPVQSGTQNTTASGKVVLYTALFDVDNADGALMPQMSAQVFFVLGSARNVLTVPLAALAPVSGSADRFVARVLTRDGIRAKQIRIGIRDRLNGELLEGLAKGDALVTDIRRTRVSRSLRW